MRGRSYVTNEWKNKGEKDVIDVEHLGQGTIVPQSITINFRVSTILLITSDLRCKLSADV